MTASEYVQMKGVNMSVNGSHGYDEPIGVSVVHQFISVNGISLHVAQCGDQD